MNNQIYNRPTQSNKIIVIIVAILSTIFIIGCIFVFFYVKNNFKFEKPVTNTNNSILSGQESLPRSDSAATEPAVENTKLNEVKTFTNSDPKVSFDYDASYSEFNSCLRKNLIGNGKILIAIAESKSITDCKNPNGETVISLSSWSPALICKVVNFPVKIVDSCATINEKIVRGAISKLSSSTTNIQITPIKKNNISGFQVDSSYYNEGTGIGALASGVGPKGSYAEQDVVFQDSNGTYFVLDILRKDSFRASDLTVINGIIESLKF